MIANSIICMGSARILQKLYTNDLAVSGTTSFSSLAVSGNATVGGTLKVTGNTTLSTITATGTVILSKTTDLSGTADNAPALIIGGTRTQNHIECDSNEIQAKASSTTVNDLYINTDGGIVYLSNGSKIKASNGTFTTQNLTVSTSASIASLTSPKIVADNINVLDTIRAASYSIDSIQAIGSSLYISPTIICSPSATVAITAISGNTVTAAIIDSTTIKSDSLGGVQWTQYSKIKISGKIGDVILEDSITVDSGAQIRGTCNGVLTAKMNTTAGRINCTFTCSQASSLSVKTYSASEISDLRIMIYEKGVDSTTSYPVGIFLTGYGADNDSYLDIYQGEDSRTKPRVRLGKLSGLDSSLKIADNNFSGFGLFADNAYLKGVIYATAGVMGGWTISSDRIYHTGNTPSSANTVLSPGGVSSTTAIGGSSGTNTWAFTIKNIFGITTSGALYSTSGKIGGWTIGTNNLHNGTTSMTNTTAGIYLGTGGIRNYKDANTFVNITGGVITAKAVDLTGKITATDGEIGGWTIDSNSIYSGTKNTGTSSGDITLNTANFTRTINGTSRTNLRIAVGGNFGLKNDGTLYASGAIISGEITATTGSIGGWTIDSSHIKKDMDGGIQAGLYAPTTPTSSNAAFYIETTNEDESKSYPFIVRYSGKLTSTNADITGKITATSGEIGGWTIKENYLATGTATAPAANSMILCPNGTTSSYTIAGTASTGWMITAGTTFGVNKNGGVYATSGKIGGWTLGTNNIHNGTTSMTSTTAGIFIGTGGIRNYKDANTYVNITNGIITAKAVDLTGKITATDGSIGGYHIDSDSIYTGTKRTGTADGDITLSSVDFTRTINSYERKLLRFAIGASFGVTKSGVLYTGNIECQQISAMTKILCTELQCPTIKNITTLEGNSTTYNTITNIDEICTKSFSDQTIQGTDLNSDSFRVSKTEFSRHMMWHDTDASMDKIRIALGSCFAIRNTNQLMVDIWSFRYQGVVYRPDLFATTNNDNIFSGKITITGGANTSGSAALDPGLTVKDILITGRLSNKFANDNSHASALPLGIYNAGTDKYIFYKISSSSIRYKDVGHKLTSKDIDKLYNVNVYNAKYKDGYLAEGDELEGKYFPMFIAEEIEKVLPEAVIHLDGKVENWNDRVMIPTMFQMIKSQKEQIDRLENELKKLKESR